VAYIQSFSSLYVGHTTPYHTNRLPPKEDRLLKRLARQWPFSTTNTLRSRWIVNRRISRRTLNRRITNKFYLYCTCRYLFETPAKLEFCKGTGELKKTCFVVL
jgi:hypothetical protein